jgi:cobalt-precorrin-7 (C5)-methyltransferase
MNKIYIIGIGPGSKDYLLPIAKTKIEDSDLLIGTKRLLSLFKDLKKETIPLKTNLDQIVSYIKETRKEKKIALLVSGDPGLYSLLNKISKILNRKEYQVIPGISSISLAAAKIGQPWQDYKIISLHGRKINNLASQVKNNPKIALLTDSKNSPEKIAQKLLAEGISNKKIIVFENLGYTKERIIETNLKTLSKMKGFGMCVMFITN